MLLEAESVGFGASGRNTGLLNAGLSLPPQQVLQRLGQERGGRILQELGNGPRVVTDLIRRHGIDCELETAGTLNVAVSGVGRAVILDLTEQWTALGAPVEFLDAEATAGKIGSTLFLGSMWDHRAGTIQPLAYARGLARAALGAGAIIHTSSRVTSLERRPDGWLARTQQGAVRADWLILATNGYTGGLVPEIRKEMVLLPIFHLATPRIPAAVLNHILPERQAAWCTTTVPVGIRRDRTGRLVFCSVGAPRAGGSFIHRRWAERELRRIFPVLTNTTFEVGWHGMIGMTRDNLPHLHVLGPNGLSISGDNGRGIAPCTVYGRALAEHILGRLAFEDLPLPSTPTAPISFRALRAGWYEAGAQLAHAATSVFQDGRR